MCIETTNHSIFSQHGNHGRRPPRPLPPPIVLRRPFRHDRPLPHSNYNVGYARFFMISSGGAGKTKFVSNHIFKGRIKNIHDNQMGFSAAPRRQLGSGAAATAASAAVAAARSSAVAHSAMVAARWQQRGGCGGFLGTVCECADAHAFERD